MFLLSKLVNLYFGLVLSSEWYRNKLYKAAIDHKLRHHKYGKLALSRLNNYMSKHHTTHQEFIKIAGSSNYQQAFWASDLGFVWFNNSINNENLYFKYALQSIVSNQLGSILDVGCGWGAFCFEAAKIPGVTNVLGIDISEKIIKEAKTRHTANNLNYSVSEIFDVKESYDLVSIFGSIDYISPDKIEAFLFKMLALSNREIFIVNSLRGIPIEEAKMLKTSREIKRYDLGYVQPLHHFFANKNFKYFKHEKMGEDSQIIHIVK
jgi:2-polyprenyl-3-methyl-5-hydroxy-6-metoxy-1,4-benzoquinol methylase